MAKAPTPTEKSKKQSDKTENATKTSSTKRLRTYLGRSVGVTTATQLVWLNRFTVSQPSQPKKTVQSKEHAPKKL